MLRLASIIVTAAALASCGETARPVAADPLPKKPASKVDPTVAAEGASGAGAGAATGDEGDPVALATGKQSATVASKAPVPGLEGGLKLAGDLRVLTQSGAELCTGKVNALAKLGGPAGFSFEFPNSKATCMGLEIDLGLMLGQFAKQGLGAGKTSVFAKNGIVYANELFGAKFVPARPMLIGPIIQDMGKYAGIDERRTHTVTITDKATGSAKSATGEIEIKVLETNATFGKYDQILHFEMTTSGFEGVDKVGGMLFDKMEMYINARPLAFPMFAVEMPLDALSSSGAFGGDVDGVIGIASTLLGSIRTEFTLTEMSAE